MKTLQSVFIAGAEWFENKSMFCGNEQLRIDAEEYAEGQTTDAERNLNRAIDAETELRKAKELLTEWMASAESRIISDGLGDKTKLMIEL